MLSNQKSERYKLKTTFPLTKTLMPVVEND